MYYQYAVRCGVADIENSVFVSFSMILEDSFVVLWLE